MDIKALEYMGERVDKARKLQGKIREVEIKIKGFGNRDLHNIAFVFERSNNININDINIGQEVTAATINALINYRDVLQKELDEL